MKEETGLDLIKITGIFPASYNSSGMSDESVHIVLGYCIGTPSQEFLQDNEDIETFLVDTDDAEFIDDETKKWSTNARIITAFY